MKPAIVFILTILSIASGFSQTVEINLSSATASFTGEHAGDLAGHHVSVIGDINGDSFDDIIITAPGWDQHETSMNNGANYLFYGSSSGFSGTIDLATADAIFIGATGQEAAHDVFGIGDVDGDGYNDFAIGLKKYHAVVDDTLRNKLGKVYIFFGSPTQRVGAIALENADASLEGTNEYAEAAHVKGVGDINNDNYDDIIVGAGFHSQVGAEAGKIYVFFGRDRNAWPQNAAMEDVANATFLAEAEFDWAGHRVADVGDVNGDGLMDFIIGANYHDHNGINNSGKVYLILGKANGWTLDTPLTDADASWVGTTSKMGLGWNVGNPGDIDGDGLNDIIIGGMKYETFVLLGKNISYAANQSIDGAADIKLMPPESSADDIGHDIHSLGDLNGDTIDDFIIGGSKFSSDGLTQAGKAFVFWGRQSWPAQLNMDDADMIFTAENAGDAAGFSVSGDGDLNNDGVVDFLITAPQVDNQTGKIYLFHTVAPTLTLTHPNGGEIFGAGEQTNITWTTDPDVDRVTLDLSIDNGDSWETIAENVADNGAYTWTVPAVQSDLCLVRIKDAFDGDPQDQSDAVFSITNEATITVISPNGGESLTAGSSFNIQWSSFNFNENVKIELSVDDGLTWDAITVDTENDGLYAWIVPDRPTRTGRIRITGSPTYAIQDASDAPFTISGSNFIYHRIEAEDAKLSPGYEVEERAETSNGKVVRLRHQAVGTIAYKFDLPPAEYELYVRYLDEIDGVSRSVININRKQVAEWHWDMAESSDVFLYRSVGTFTFDKNDNIELWTLHDNGEYARVDYFEFVRLEEHMHSLSIISPNGGEEWPIGSSQEIVWTAENSSGSFNIHLTRDAGATWETLVDGISVSPGADDKYRTTLSVTGPASDSCLVKVVDVLGAPVDQSDDFFKIVEPPTPLITVTHPNGGETWYLDSIVTITWESENTSGNVKIELSRDAGSTWRLLTDGTNDDGDFEWKVGGAVSERCLIRVRDVTGDVSDTSDDVFVITGKPVITVTSPAGGESWQTGSTEKIRWTSNYINSTIDIELTRNSGETWESLVSDFSNSGDYDWLVTGPETTSARVRIKATDGTAADSSEQNFAIFTPASITVTQPNGGEEWQIGDVEKISWELVKVSGMINIELSRDAGQTWQQIVELEAQSGTVEWTVSGPTTNQALIRVSSEDSTISDTSDAVFSIVDAPRITIMSPNGGEAWAAGSVQKITWNAYRAGAFVKIDVSRDAGATWDMIIDSTKNSGEFAWLVTLPESENCLVRVLDMSGSPADSSDATFRIVDTNKPILSLTSPNGGEIWTAGDNKRITWFSANLESDVNIELSRDNGANWETLAEAAADSGAFHWAVTQPASDHCLVRVSAVNGALTDESDTTFSITPRPALTIQSPDGGEQWAIGTSQTIYWTSANSSGAVKIELTRDNGANWETLIDSTQDSGSFSWKVTGPLSITCLIMVSDINGTPFDVSNTFFSIVQPPSITIESPNGGEIWQIGSEQNITWTFVNVPDTVEIHLSRDKGLTWETLITNAVNNGSWTWMVTEPVSESCLIRVGLPSGDVMDESDAPFKIDIADGVARASQDIPSEYALMQNYPNPFNPVTRIQYNVPQRSHVRVEVYNPIGAKIATLVNDTQAAGVYALTWNGKDDHGNQMSSGIYFYRMSADGFSQTKRMMLIK